MSKGTFESFPTNNIKIYQTYGIIAVCKLYASIDVNRIKHTLLISFKCDSVDIGNILNASLVQGRLPGAVERVHGLDERGTGAVSQRSLRPTVSRLRSVRAAQGVRGARDAAAATADRRGAGDGAVQAEPVRGRRGVFGEPRLPDRARLQAIPVRGRLQGGRGVALPGAGGHVRQHTHVQRAKGLCQDMPVHQEGHREVSAGAVLAVAVLLADRQNDR